MRLALLGLACLVAGAAGGVLFAAELSGLPWGTLWLLPVGLLLWLAGCRAS